MFQFEKHSGPVFRLPVLLSVLLLAACSPQQDEASEVSAAMQDSADARNMRLVGYQRKKTEVDGTISA